MRTSAHRSQRRPWRCRSPAEALSRRDRRQCPRLEFLLWSARDPHSCSPASAPPRRRKPREPSPAIATLLLAEKSLSDCRSGRSEESLRSESQEQERFLAALGMTPLKIVFACC